MSEGFGARLRRRREEQAISLAAIAQHTKIKSSLLEALERDDISHWPPGIFRRSFVRAYAQAVGLDPDATLREFLELHPDPPDILDAALGAPLESGATRGDGAPPTRIREIVGTAFSSLARLRRSAPIEPLRLTNPQVEVPTPAPLEQPRPPDPPAEIALDAAEMATNAAEIAPEVAEVAPDVREVVPDAAQVVTDVAISRAEGPPTSAFDLMAVADLCTRLALVEHAADVPPLLEAAAGLMRAKGLIVWIWNDRAALLEAAAAHGYSAKMLAQLPGVPRDAENATAAAFRSAEPCAVEGGDHGRAALVVPIMAPAGCAGVLAIELAGGGERSPYLRPTATIVAALLARLIRQQALDDSAHAGIPARRSTA
jgi:transcriptional regulator with XRE-family HTH domain